MQKVSGNFPYGIIPVSGVDITLVLLFILEYLHAFQIELSRNIALVIAVLLTFFVFLSPVYLWAAIYAWKHKNTHKYGYDELGLYQDGQMIVSWKEVESVEFQRTYDSWYKAGHGIWARPAYYAYGTPKGKIKQLPSGSITFHPKRGFGIDQVELAIPITEKVASMKRIHRKMKAFVVSAGWDSVFEIRMK